MHNMSLNNSDYYNKKCPSLLGTSSLSLELMLTDSNKIHFSIIAYVNKAIAFQGAFLNLSLIIVFFKLRQLSVSNIPLFFLAIWDLLTSLISQPVFGAYLTQLTNRELTCGVFTVALYFGATATMTSSLTALVVTTERYLALFYVFFWTHRVTRRMLAIPLSLMWVPSLLFCFFMFDMKNHTIGVAIFTFFSVLALIWISFCYVKIFKHVRRIQMVVANTTVPQTNENENNKRKQARLSKFSIVVIAFFLTFNIPYCFASMLIHSGALGKGEFIQPLEWYMITFLMFNSLLNPIVYAWQSPKLGRGMLELWRIRKPGVTNNN